MTKKRNKNLLIQINEIREPNTNLVVLRIALDAEFTRIDFGYIATNYFVKGGWIRISPETYIQVQGHDAKLQLTHADGIPLAPKQFYFESNKDWHYFSLFFPPIPQESCNLNIIEAENPDANDFNYYGIDLNIENAFETFSMLN